MKKFGFAAVVLCAAAGAAMGESLVFGSHNYMNLGSGATTYGPRSVVYSNIASTANAAFSSADLGGTWGDTLSMTGGGVLDQFSFTIFNSANAANTLPGFKSGTININFFDATSSAFIGGFSGNLSYGTDSLAKGFFDIWTFTGLSGLGINLSSNVIVTQNFTASTVVGSLRMGVASLNPVTVGSSTNTLYISNSTTPAGFYTSGTTQVNLGYEVNVIPAPGSLALIGLGGLVVGRRRR